MRYPEFSRVSGYANELKDALRRRKHSREPRVRVRLGHGEPRIVEPGSPQAARLLELAGRFASQSKGGAQNG